jgi:hypothetical protein
VGTPTATWIIGRDESESDYCVLYTDDRRVSRVYRMSFSDRTWRMWRDTSEFAQRFDAEVGPSQAEITGSWQKSADGGKNMGARFHGPLQPPCTALTLL